MQRNIILGVVAVIVIAGAFLFLRPEPTPQERLRDAAELAGDAARDATEALGEAAQEAAEATSAELSDAATELSDRVYESAAAMAESINAASQDTKDTLNALIAEWRATGVVTEDGIDFDAAIAAIDTSDLDASSKARLTALINSLREAPDVVEAKLSELEAALAQ